jgi:plastocyanin
MEQDAQCAAMYPDKGRREEDLVTGPRGELANVFVYLKEGLAGKKFAIPDQPALIDQKGCWFGPRVVGMRAGQSLQVVNSDSVTHNIHPMPSKNREWNASMAPGDAPIRRKFSHPEVMVPVKCNVHRWMRAWVGVVEHPYFAVTDSAGAFQIPDVPPGRYTIAAWQESLGWVEMPLEVKPGGTTRLEIRFEGKKP